MYKVISIDEEKELILGYSPLKADDFHEESARNADKKFQSELKKIKNQNKKVILMCGGSASGKTEFIDKLCPAEKFYPQDELEGIVFDSTLSKINGAEIKIKKIIKSGNIPIVCLILPDSLSRCFAAFNKRDRKIPEERFYETHSGARKIVLHLAKTYPNLEILIYQNSYQPDNEDNLPFLKVEFEERKEMIDYLQRRQFSSEEIKSLIINGI